MKHNLYITQKSEIKREGNTLRISTLSNTVTVPLSVIENLYLFGKIRLSGGAQNFLLANNIEIYFLSSTGKLNGILGNSKLRSNYTNRLMQYQAYENKIPKIASLFVRTKIEEIEKYVNRSLKRYLVKLDDSKSVDSLRGIEGAATLYLFNKVREELATVDIVFETRSYNPPKDEVNALLSFIYTLQYGYIYSIVLSFGLDPYLGFLHQKRGKHAPLVSDIMESQRIQLTQFVVNLFLEKKITLEDFDIQYRLKQEKMREVLLAYTKKFTQSKSKQQEIEAYIKNIVGAF
jgi:CRISPR-associated protein Cas1